MRRFCESVFTLAILFEEQYYFYLTWANNNPFASTVCREPEFMTSLYVSHIRPLLDYASPMWNSGYLEDLRLLERVQRRWTRSIRGLKTLAYDERLNALNLFSLQGRLLPADLIRVWKIFHSKCSLSPENFFVLSLFSTTRGHPFQKFSIQIKSCSKTKIFLLQGN